MTQLEAFFKPNDINTNDKKRALLISTLSTKVVGVLVGDYAPRKVNKHSYEEALAFLNAHYVPKCNEVVASYKFFTWDQTATKSVQDYVVELCKLADKYNFGTGLDHMLRSWHPKPRSAVDAAEK